MAVTTADGRRDLKAASTKASDSLFFRLETKIGTAVMPFARNAAVSASIGAASAARSIER